VRGSTKGQPGPCTKSRFRTPRTGTIIPERVNATWMTARFGAAGGQSSSEIAPLPVPRRLSDLRERPIDAEDAAPESLSDPSQRVPVTDRPPA
jgi:hypothetical protein